MEPGASERRRAETPRKGPRWKIVIRMMIYIPVLGFVTWQAAQRFVDDRLRANDDRFRASVQQWLAHPPRTIVMPNGETMPVLELTEQEAIEMGILPDADPEPAPAPASAPAPTSAPTPAE